MSANTLAAGCWPEYCWALLVMQKQGVANFWIGNGCNQRNLNRITEYTISDGGLGDFVPAPFCLALGIEQYEPDYFGGRVFPKQLTKLSLLFHGEPCLPQLQERWPEIPPSNSSVGMYDYEYDGRINEFEIENFSFIFLGYFPYS